MRTGPDPCPGLSASLPLPGLDPGTRPRRTSVAAWSHVWALRGPASIPAPQCGRTGAAVPGPTRTHRGAGLRHARRHTARARHPRGPTRRHPCAAMPKGEHGALAACPPARYPHALPVPSVRRPAAARCPPPRAYTYAWHRATQGHARTSKATHNGDASSSHRAGICTCLMC